MASTSADDFPGKLFTTIDCKQGAVRAVRFNVDGNYCITCGGDKTIKLWNPHRTNGFLVKTYTGHGYEVLDACASSDNSQIASCGGDKQIFVWDVASGKQIRKFNGHAGRVNAVAFNEESTVVFSASIDSTVKAWDCKSKAKDPIQVLDDAKDNVTTITVSDHEILTGSADCHVRRYDLRVGKMFQDFVGASVTSVAFTRDGQCELVSSLDSTIRLLDKDSGELLQDFTGHKNGEYKIDSVLNHSDSQVFSGSEDGCVFVWDLIEAKLVTKLEVPSAKRQQQVVHSLSFHPKQPCLVAASLGNVHVFKPQSVAAALARRREDDVVDIADD